MPTREHPTVGGNIAEMLHPSVRPHGFHPWARPTSAKGGFLFTSGCTPGRRPAAPPCPGCGVAWAFPLSGLLEAFHSGGRWQVGTRRWAGRTRAGGGPGPGGPCKPAVGHGGAGPKQHSLIEHEKQETCTTPFVYQGRPPASLARGPPKGSALPSLGLRIPGFVAAGRGQDQPANACVGGILERPFCRRVRPFGGTAVCPHLWGGEGPKLQKVWPLRA